MGVKISNLTKSMDLGVTLELLAYYRLAAFCGNLQNKGNHESNNTKKRH